MLSKRIPLILFSAALACAQAPTPQAQPPQENPAQEKKTRDLKIEKIGPANTPEPPPDGRSVPKLVLIPRSYAVIVGVSRYQKLPENLQLQFAERDAQSIFTALISPEGGNFKVENVHLLTNDKATLAALKREIDGWLPSVAKEGDRVLIYFAGHGFLKDGKGYLAPHDFDLNHADTTGYPMDELGSVIGSKINATYKILLTDACHSGAITPDEVESLNKTLANLNKSLFSLTASRARERSFESPDLMGGHGVFTYFVVQGMEGAADTTGDGVVSADELAEYVHTEVRKYTGGQQNPTSDKANYDPEMLLAYVPSNAKPAESPAPKTGTLIFETNMDDVEVFVDGNTIGVLSKGKAVSVPGLLPGEHTVKGVRMGYEPDGPRQEMVYPGQETTVSVKISIARRRNKAAEEWLDNGLKFYQKGYQQNYRKAVEAFQKALQLDPTYSQAAYYLARTYNALFDEDKAQEYFKTAIEIDPDYLEARANYGGMLLDVGATDESIRQLNTVLQRQPNHAQALTMLAQAYRSKELFPQAIDAARKAVKLAPKRAEPHLWLADSLRFTSKYVDAIPEYDQYLQLSDFNSKLAGQLNYYVLGSLIGLGRKKRAAEQDIWKEFRDLAYFGKCECEQKLARLDAAIADCQTALTYDSKDPFAHFTLAVAFMTRAKKQGSVAELSPALNHFQQMLAINPDLDQASIARKNVTAIQEYFRRP
ncbi:MAG TPA: tetratricopeptide repeat protein [Candidatus Acidoferrales bacterium]|jgi:tetratricopeptide (TPR) repeat protein|nr:tetratricopeptide repeat protein [Candidatus Acidoferrales bacterium]